jgi:hypothetical protein
MPPNRAAACAAAGESGSAESTTISTSRSPAASTRQAASDGVQAIGSARRAADVVGQRLERLAGPPAAVAVHREARAGAVQPGRHRGRIRDLRAAAPQPRERLLRHVLGLGRVAQHAGALLAQVWKYWR